MQLKHFKFRTKLIDKCDFFDTKVIVCTEEYTSKTCSGCGHIDYNLGSSEVYNCSTNSA
jgi:transposase